MSDEREGTPDVGALKDRLQAAIGDGYVVERELGAGGFAVVFLVRDVALKRKLAVKVLSPDLITSNTVMERFRREAETVAQLTHANIVPLHFIGQKDDLLYLAMAFVDGGALSDRIEKNPSGLPIDEVRRAMVEVASALAHAHKRGVVHRDIKPQNVLIDAESARCLVTDFGIARTADGGSLTATGMMIGTPAYISPEQVTGEPSDHRADIFALGVMAYEMATGKQPFEAPTPTAVLMKRLAGPPVSAEKIRSGLPRDLAETIEGCLAPDPNERVQNADDIVRALGGAGVVTSGGQHTAQFVIKSKQARRRKAALIATITVIAAVGAVFAVKSLGGGGAANAVAKMPVDSGMVSVLTGDYTIGSDSAFPNARPAHKVTIPAFGIDAREVTVGEYKAFAAATGAPVPWTGAGPDDALPVTRVQWGEAQSYCKWKHADGGDLPTEEQWEAAARGTEGRRYPWGEEPRSGIANTASAKRTGPVPPGTFVSGATPNGIFDLIGNVFEWTKSPMQAYPGATPMPDSLKAYRVIRGGMYETGDNIATAWLRGYNRPAAPRDELTSTGFRCAMPVRAQ